jgi:hypothetical protein
MAKSDSLDPLAILLNRQPEKTEPKKEESYEVLFNRFYANHKERQRERVAGTTRAIAQGATLGFADELEAMIRAESKPMGDYDQELDQIREKQKEFEALQPKVALAAEAAGAIPTGLGGARALSALGVKSVGKQAGAEAAVYGAGSGAIVLGRFAYSA